MGRFSCNRWIWLLWSIMIIAGISVTLSASDSDREVTSGHRMEKNEIDTERDESRPVGKKPRVAVLDSGIRTGKGARVIPPRYLEKTVSFVDGNASNTKGGTHGTIVTTIIHRIARRGARFYDVRVLPKNMKSSSHGNSADILAGLDWVASREEGTIQVANLAFAAKYPATGNTMLQSALRRVIENGTLPVTGAGNDSAPVRTEKHKYVPAAYPETLTVSAVNYQQGKLVEFSNYGEEVDVAGSSRNAPETSKFGTSIPAAMASGIAVRLNKHMSIEQREQATPRHQIWDLVQQGRKPPRSGSWKNDPDGITEPFLPQMPRYSGQAPPRTFHFLPSLEGNREKLLRSFQKLLN